MGSGPYFVVLVVGAAIVVLDGQLILRNSPGYLAEVYGMQPARRLAMLVAVFFHLVMLGLVALVASIGLSPDSSEQAIVTRIGVILLLTALGHAVTMMILSRLREEQESTDLAEAQLVAQRGLIPSRRGRRMSRAGRGGRPRNGPTVRHGRPDSDAAPSGDEFGARDAGRSAGGESGAGGAVSEGSDGEAGRNDEDANSRTERGESAGTGAERTGGADDAGRAEEARRAEDAGSAADRAERAEPGPPERDDGGPGGGTGRPRAHYHSSADAPDAAPGVEIATADVPPPPRRQPANTRPSDTEQPRARQPR
jgi:hypothetical protein